MPVMHRSPRLTRIRTIGSIASALFFLSVGSTAIADTKRDDFPQVYTMSPTGVNLQSGTFMRTETDLIIGTLSFIRSYRTTPSFYPQPNNREDNHYFGRWNHNYGFGVQIRAPNDDLEAHVYTNGTSVMFVWRPLEGGWMPFTAEAFGNELTEVGGNFVFRNRNGDVFYMQTHPALVNPARASGTQIVQRIDYANGTQWSFTYNSSARLRTVQASNGYSIVLDYGTNGRISVACGYNHATNYVSASSTCAASPTKVNYGYTNTSDGHLLTSVTARDGSVTGIQYDTTVFRNVTCITIPGTSTCEVTNVFGPQPGESAGLTGPDQVRIQTFADGKVWRFSYLPPPIDRPPYPLRGWNSTSFMTEPDGFVSTGTYVDGFMTKFVDRAGQKDYEYYGVIPWKFGSPEGDQITVGRDDHQNMLGTIRQAKPGSGLADISYTIAHPYDRRTVGTTPVGCLTTPAKICNKPLYRTDELGNRTDFAHDPAHGGMLTETRPAVNGIRPQKRFEYVQRYAWIRNSANNGYVQAAAPQWVLSRERYCKSTAASGASCAGGAADEVITDYDYGPNSGPNNLLLRGIVVTATNSAGVIETQRTCYRYDQLGRRISETKPLGTGATCP